ncbi:MAG: oxidoreductase, 2OG-Fe(II) oxygenase family [Planctomycetaceae bacterium]|nr:oxidoreductase, 2OG-Fe(II) oxygenase family [Planctomycetaceae bacterium]
MFDIDPTAPTVIEIPGLLNLDECNSLITKIEGLGPEIATINTLGGTEVVPDVRNNDRVIFDDEQFAQTLLSRIEDQAPKEIYQMSLVGINERFRCYRYKPGMRFARHRDGAFHRNHYERSCYSFLVYLNEDFEGGQTAFFAGYTAEPVLSIHPKTGMGLLFQHRLLHEGCIVTSGVKYVARTDLMYRKESSRSGSSQTG